ncbi:MAG: oligosaccharide flippase family protein [Aphanocapsa lilacina HA4352-LM1]|jgi:O-antigen/teichoic acid export membrane protein|nr:oligosaccharide flippase family protein [Aphanocapsa lilacina HA4352-LM1]
MDRTRRVLLNAVATLGARLGALLIGLALAPYAIGILGSEAYGLWAVLSSAVAYIALLDLGLGTACIQAVATYTARGELARVRQVITAGVLFFVLAGLVLSPLAVACAPVLMGWLKLSPALVMEGSRLFVLVYVCAFAASVASVLAALLAGLEKMRIGALLQVASQVGGATSAALLLPRFGLWAMAFGLCMYLALYLVGLYLSTRRLFGPVFTNPLRLEKAVLKPLLGFGGWMQVNNTAAIVNLEADRLLIAGFVNVASVTAYEVANKMALLARALPLTLLSALLPSAAAVAASDPDRLDQIYVRTSRFLALATFALGGFIAGAAAPLARVWIGRDFAWVPAMTALLVVSYAVNNLTGPGTTLLRALGRPRYESYYALTGAALNVGITLALAPRFGLAGILGGTALGSLIGSLLFLWLYHCDRKLGWWIALGSWLWRVVLPTGVSAATLAVVVTWLPGVWFAERLGGMAVLAALLTVYVGILLALLRLVRFFEPGDLDLVRGLVPVRWKGLCDWPPVVYLFGG